MRKLLLGLMVIALTLSGCANQQNEVASIGREMTLEEIKEDLIKFQGADEELSNYINAYVGLPADDIPATFIGLEEEISLLELVKEREGSIVEFMAPWCQSCEKLVPDLEELQKVTDQKVISIVVFTETREEIDEFIEKTGSTSDYLWAQTEEGIDSYGIQYVPTIFYIDRDGIIKGIFSQSTSPARIKQFIDSI